ncbi:MAG TPA: sulfate ABC transporter substrate-binding protein, partial [Firmicutes bacterium]|nr:sulfate ABC transporter substrate-binding protein [Bacillota bacterium]
MILMLVAIVAGCGGCGGDGESGGSGADRDRSIVIRVGYFPNLTHAQAIIGAARGDFAAAA